MRAGVTGTSVSRPGSKEGAAKPAVRARFLPLWFIAPGLLLSCFIVLYPTYQLVQTSLRRVSRFGLVGDFNDFDNFRKVFADPLFLEALTRTLFWTLLVVGGTLVLSAAMSLILNQKFCGRGLARVIVMLPWSLSLSLLTVVWRWAFNGQSGYLNHLLLQLGVIDQPVSSLADGTLAFTVQVIIGILVSVPFTTAIFLGGLSSLPADIYEAARMEGATAWHSFRTLTVPMMRSYINIAVVLNVIYVFNSFPIIWILTEGGPANSTDILVTYLYKIAFKYGKLGEASVVSLLMVIFLLACSVLYLRLISKERADA